MKACVLFSVILISGAFAVAGTPGAAAVDVPEEVYELGIKAPDGDDITVSVFNEPGETDLEGRLVREYHFYCLKFPFRGNYFSVNLPEESYFEAGERRLKRLLSVLLSVFSDTFRAAEDLLGEAPDGIRYNITFGRLSSGVPHNRIYQEDKASNVFPGFVPYSRGEEPLSARDTAVLRHEFGHSAFAVIIGNFRHPKFKFIEEGMVDHLAHGEGPWPGERLIVIGEEEAGGMRGLAQMDIDVSVWGEDVLEAPEAAEGYRGITHHCTGEHFIMEFIESFGRGSLPGFLKRLRAKDTAPSDGDYGSGQIRQVLAGMGYSREQIERFEKDFHSRLKRYVFVRGGGVRPETAR